MSNFTGEKWHVAKGSAHTSLSVRDGDEWLRARWTCHHVVRSEDSNIATVLTDRPEDARLIAAAPEMFKILQSLCVEYMEDNAITDVDAHINELAVKLRDVLKFIYGEQEDA